jgi:hypothetical protein
MTLNQWETVGIVTSWLWHTDRPNEFHSGDCVGADEQAYNSVKTQRDVRSLDIILHGHPCNLERFRAYLEYDRTHPIRPPLARNRIIVTNAETMIAAPKEYEEVKKGSGTWATIRYTDHVGKPLFIIWPDGTQEVRRVG